VEECTYFWGVNTSWGINTAESKRPLNQEDNQAPQPTSGTNFSFWKVRMKTYIMDLGEDVWDVVDTGYVKLVLLANKDDKLEFSFNAKAMNAILSGLAEAEFVKVMHLGTAKEM
jgi:hypothetical protein